MIFIFSLLLSASWAKIVIQQVEILDGSGTSKSAPMDVEITGDLISRIASRINAGRARVIDGRGRVLIPGLIDAHTHLPSIPGMPFLELTREEIRRRQTAQLRAYLAAGVTTVLDCASPASLVRDAPGPRVLTLAPFLTPLNGYFAGEEMRGPLFEDLWPPVTSEETIAREFDEAAKFKPFGAKVTMENGYGPFAVWPVFSESQRAKIVAEAASHHSPLFVHSMTKKEHRLALTLKPYALVHAGFMDEEPDAEILKELKDSGAYIITTAALEKIILQMWHPEIAQDPWYRRMVPADELRNAGDKKIRGRVIGAIATASAPPWLPGFLARIFAPMFFNERIVADMDVRSRRSILAMYKAGLPLVMGSDSGNWPLWPAFFHGVTSVLEMETLIEAGLPPGEVLTMATARAAKMLKLDGQVGRVQEGLFADLVLLKKNPLTAADAYRSAELVIKDGIAKTPAEWLAAP